jgi:integrase
MKLVEGMVGFQNTSIFDEAGSQKAGKSDTRKSADTNPLCPQCGSQRIYRDGLRYLADGSSVQRWLCRDCAYRFSIRPPQEKPEWQINTLNAIASKRRICANRKEAKNLTTATETKTVAGDKQKKLQKHIDLLPEDVRGLLTKFMAYLEREGFAEENTYPDILMHLVKDGANLLNAEGVKTVIAQQRKKNSEPWSDSMKMLAVCAYDAFCQMQGIIWSRPLYRQNEATIMVPDEKDLDMLINGANRRMSTFLLCLKETFADPTEILRAEWIDLKDNVFSINHPVKFHYPGKYELSMRLTAMLNALPRTSKKIFPMRYATAYEGLAYLRRRLAAKFHNSALLQISFKSFRHWGGSMIAYYSNGNAVVIARMLRHKSWKSTQKYVHTIEFKEEDYEETVASTPEEIRALGKAGWTKYDEGLFGGVHMHFYRKPKRFGSLKTIDNKSKTMGISNYNS